jgi:hypothetical protein
MKWNIWSRMQNVFAAGQSSLERQPMILKIKRLHDESG